MAKYLGNLMMSYDYYPFGMQMPGRQFNSDSYRYGFNGHEKDDEVKGSGNSLDFGARIYDSRLGKFLSLDPLSYDFPSESNYSSSGDNPIYYIDKDGEFKYPADKEASYRKSYPLITKFFEMLVHDDVSSSSKIINGLIKVNPNLTPEIIKGMADWDNGPEIKFKEAPGEFPTQSKEAAGYTPPAWEGNEIQLNAGYATYLEDLLKSGASSDEKLAALTRFYMTLIHEWAHYNNRFTITPGGNYQVATGPNSEVSQSEVGYQAESEIWGTDTYNHNSDNEIDLSYNGVGGISSYKYTPGVVEEIIEQVSTTTDGKASLPTLPQN